MEQGRRKLVWDMMWASQRGGALCSHTRSSPRQTRGPPRGLWSSLKIRQTSPPPGYRQEQRWPRITGHQCQALTQGPLLFKAPPIEVLT